MIRGGIMMYLRRKPAAGTRTNVSSSGPTTMAPASEKADSLQDTTSGTTNTATMSSSSHKKDDGKKKKQRYCKRSTIVATVSCLSAVFLVYMQGRIVMKYLFLEDSGGGGSTTTTTTSNTMNIRRDRGFAVEDFSTTEDGNSSLGKFCTALQMIRTSNTDMSQLWIEHILTILEATRHPDDPNYSHQEWTKSLLVELPPTVLQQQQQRHYPNNDQTNISRILDIIRKRIENPLLNPPLKIAVLGGSTTEGSGCDIASVKPPKDSMMGNPTYCAWPFRLESFINNILWTLFTTTTTIFATQLLSSSSSSSFHPIVKVVSMAEEGTSTTVKSPLLKYWMYPKELLPEGPDIIIHAYTARDALPFEQDNESLIDALHREVQTLVESVKVARPCGHPPLVINLSDTSLLFSHWKNKELQHSTKNDINNIFLSLDYTKVISKVSAFERKQLHLQQQQYLDDQDIAFGMAGHVAIVWLLTYNIAQAVLQSCDDKSKLTTSTIYDSNKCQESPCVLAWLAGPTGTAFHAHQINTQLAPFIVENTGWRSETDMTTGWSRKAGLVAVERNAKLVLALPNLPIAIRMINIMSVKSYSSKFLNSVARFQVSVLSKGLSDAKSTAHNDEEPYFVKWSTSFDMEGTHSSMTHITFPFALDMKENAAQIGDQLQVEVTLVSGTTFKILGMMFCSR